MRKRQISYGARTEEGVQAWDTFMTLADTSKKLGVSFYHYIHDHITESYPLSSLADLIRQRAQEAGMGVAWLSP